MASSWVRSNLDAQQYEGAFVGERAEVTPTGAGMFRASLVCLTFHQTWVCSGEESGPCIKHLKQAPERAFVTFLTEPRPDVLIDGMAMPAMGLLRHSAGHRFYERSSGVTARGTVSLPVEGMAEAGIVLSGFDLTPPRNTLRITPQRAAMDALRCLHREASALAKSAPATLTHPEVGRALEQSLVGSMVKCLCPSETAAETWAYRRHETVMHRFRRVLDENPERPLYVPEICAAIGVPDRTLRLCVQEHLGMGPKRYLTLRRLTLAHRALGAASPDVTTVTDIATQNGFWHFGRFAASYRFIFGELPSMTLKRSSG